MGGGGVKLTRTFLSISHSQTIQQKGLFFMTFHNYMLTKDWSKYFQKNIRVPPIWPLKGGSDQKMAIHDCL